MASNAPQVRIADRADWRRWLEANHATSDPIWLVYEKKQHAASRPRLTYDDIVEEALCFGWIDSLPRALDDRHTMLYLSPRKPSSVWSALNKRRVESLEARGLIMPAGRALIDLAKSNGRWNALDQVESLTIPPDLRVALDQNPKARTHFEAFPPSARKGILTWITLAKRAETRAARVADAVRLAAMNVRANTPSARGK